MGIKNLNRFLKENCSKHSIRKINLKQLENKVIVIDTSIYLYRYIYENALLENMYLLISLLLENKIIPLFVFDGKPPPEKLELIRKRKLEKKNAEDKYNNLLIEYNDKLKDRHEKAILEEEMKYLKQKFVRVCEKDITKVKQLLNAYGIMYYESPNEADEVCAYLVKTGKAWACLSDDMDMFLYGCQRVIRNISLLNRTVLYYDTECILNELCMTEEQFKQIMVLSGTDYNIHSKTDLDTTILWYSKYTNNLVTKKISTNISFYSWLLDETNYITNIDELNNICEIFNINHIKNKELDTIEIVLNERNNEILHNIMKLEGFVFT